MSPQEKLEHRLLPRGKRLLARQDRLLDLALAQDLEKTAPRALTEAERQRFSQISGYAAKKAFISKLDPARKPNE